MAQIEMKVTIKLLTPLHVGGEPGEDANTSYMLRGADGKAYYPGTAFKGKARYYARQLQNDSCAFPGDCNCAVCRLFGGEGNSRGSLFFSNFFDADEAHQQTDVRAGNSIDRYRRVAEDEKLFTTESAAIGALVGYITGSVGVGDDRGEGDVELLKESIKLIRQIGGNTSRGFGWVDGEIAVEGGILADDPENGEGDKDASGAQQNSPQHESQGGAVTRVTVKLTPKSPLLIGKHTSQSNFRDTQHLIPGAVFRAAMARAICERDGTLRTKSEVNFVEAEVSSTAFPNLRRQFGELRFSALCPENKLEPYPITTRKCKYRSDHKKDDIKVDILSAILRDDMRGYPEDKKCPVCGERLEKVEPFDGFLMESGLVTSTHSEMDRLRGTSMDERLYTVRAIAPGAATFCGEISGNIDLSELSELLRPSIRVGAMITKGFGECKAEIVQDSGSSGDDLKDMRERVKGRIIAFNALLGRDSGEDMFVPLTLMSDAVVSLTEPKNGEYMAAYTPIVEPFELKRVITKSSIWRGFDTKRTAGFEKQAQFRLRAGSVFVLRVKTLDDENIDKLLQYEREGIGFNAEGGYGAVRVAHERHIEYALTRKDG